MGPRGADAAGDGASATGAACRRCRPAEKGGGGGGGAVRSLYRRVLPPSLEDFCGAGGRERFARALAAGHAAAFFPLSAHMQTQPFPAACGLTTLAVVLNAMRVDPRRVWRAPWRWYEEQALMCCSNEASVRSNGVTLAELACIARCHGLRADVHRRLSDDRARSLIRRYVAERDHKPQYSGDERADSVDAGHVANASDAASASYGGDAFLVVSFSRSAIGQTGSGHFSPVAAYDADTDSVLVLDTARFKYPPFWVSLSALNAATHDADPETGLPRGFVVLSRDARDSSPSPILRLAAALDRVCTRVRGDATWTAAELVELVLDTVSSSTMISCLSGREVSDDVAAEAARTPLFQHLRATGEFQRKREALVVLACLAACPDNGLRSDGVAIPALGRPWLEMGAGFRDAVLRLADAFRIAADGIEVTDIS